MTTKCNICNQGTVTAQDENGTLSLKCDTCESEYADTKCATENKRRQQQSTKTCPKCKHDTMIAFHSTDEKMCENCGHTINWPLTEGQKKVFNDAKRD